MNKALSVWKSVEAPAQSEAELLWHSALASVLYSDDTLPLKRSEQNYSLHLRFVRFLLALPFEGVVTTISRQAGSSSLTSYIQSAINNGWLEQSYDPQTGKRVVRPSDKLDRLLCQTGPLFREAG